MTDAIRRIGAVLAIALVAGGAATAPALMRDDGRAGSAQAGPVSVFPAPGTPTALRATEISLRGVAPDAVGSVLVTGSGSGRHEGTLEPHPDGQGVSFVPHRRFRPGERVTVRTRLDVRGGDDGDFRFTIARGDFEVGTVSAEERLPRLSRGSYHSYRSAPRIRAPRLRVVRRRSGRAPGYLVLNTGWDDDRPRPDGALIADDRGRPVWFLSRRPGRKLFDVAVQSFRGQPVITYWEGRFAAGWGYGTYVVLDQSYREIARIRAVGGNRADIHDMRLTDQGTALVASYNLVRRNGPVLDNVIQEIDVASGRLLFEWHSVGNVGLRESYVKRPEGGEQFDYFHLNSVEVGPDGDLLISARNTCAVYEIDRATGAINWRLGGKRSDFRLGEGARFCWQHDARWAGEGVMTLFDNRVAAPSQEGQSRAIKLAVDERRRTVRLLRGYKHPRRLAAPNKGGARMQPNGNLLVGWGAAPAVTEFTRRGDIVFDARFARAGDGTYRAIRAAWTGLPVTRPDVAAQRRGDRVAVWASWNGATEVARWEVLAGDAPDTLAVSASAPRRSFETALSAPGRPRYVAVRALDAAGAVLGTSRTVSVGSA
jgi:Arylsulfotransferase (ASST)